MKQIVAYIKPHKVAQVADRLHRVEGLSGASFVDVRGFGRSRAEGAQDRFEEEGIGYVRHVRVEVFCPDGQAEPIVTAIETGAPTGLRGDGKVYVADAHQAVRISTGERGEEAS